MVSIVILVQPQWIEIQISPNEGGPTRQKIPRSDVLINLIGQNGETQLTKLSKSEYLKTMIWTSWPVIQTKLFVFYLNCFYLVLIIYKRHTCAFNLPISYGPYNGTIWYGPLNSGDRIPIWYGPYDMTYII